MAARRMPTLFLSHGSPLLAIEDSAARRFLTALGPRLPRPAAVVVFSAHHDAGRVVQGSIDSARDPAWQLALGRALRPLRDSGVLLIGSGGATHNLGLYMHSAGRGEDSPPPPWVAQFNDWLATATTEGRYDDLVHYRERAPYAAENHPTPEHFLPLFATLGAAREDEHGVRLHASYDRGLLSLDDYAFGFAE